MMCDCRGFWPGQAGGLPSYYGMGLSGGGQRVIPQMMPCVPQVHVQPQHISIQQQQQHQPQQPVQHQQQSQPIQHHLSDLRSYYYNDYGYSSSSSRQMRNQAEKQRRDKLNQFIQELSFLVPMVSSSNKKLNKIEILRLSATFLRMHQTLIGEKKEEVKGLSSPMCQFLKNVFEGMEGILLVVASSGKIIFVTENVEQYLGHHQNELLGEDLYQFTHKDDEGELRRNLKPQEVDDIFTTDDYGQRRSERRSFFLRLKQRTASKNDSPTYEMVHVEGHLRIPRNQQSILAKSPKTYAYERYLKTHLAVSNVGYSDSKSENGLNSNDIVLVALVKPYKETKVCDNSILEAMKEEWFTRHLLDGTIVFADHRVSILSGYLSEEISGSSAFKYMHKEDARWVMIALRQMFSHGESYGWSAYRLQSKTGDYIYLKTQGFLECDKSAGAVTSFICINTLLDPKEGEHWITEMKEKYRPIVKKQVDPLASPASVASIENADSPLSADSPEEDVTLLPLETSEPRELNIAIDLLLSDLSQVTAQPPPPEKRTHDYNKVEIVAKSLPPVEEQTAKIGAKLPNLIGRYNRPSVITSTTASSERPKRTTESVEEVESKRLRAESKSVIVTEMRSVIKRNEPEPYDLDSIFSSDLLLSTETSFTQFSDEESLRHLEEGSSSELWETSTSDIDEKVQPSHLHLETSMQTQGVVIQGIGDELEPIPLSGDSLYRNHITQIRVQHRKQKEILKTLQHEHQNIRQVKEQDIGA